MTLPEEFSAEDERRLDELFGELVRAISDGESVDLEALLADRPDLLEQGRGYLAVAESIAVRRPSEAPHFPGYEVLGELGRGGMGCVYLARHLELGRRVALKTLPSQWAAGERAMVRFDREARAIARLTHPGIVPIFDVGTSQGLPYFTMEFVEGRTLAAVFVELVRRGRRASELSSADVVGRTPESKPSSYVRLAARIIRDVARALEHAHREGVVHRDVKPSNILLRTDGTPMLFDFGLASVEAEQGLTVTGDFVGTPNYVSPEQAEGRAVGSATDIFSLGATLYEFLTLERPFAGVSTHAVLRAIREREPQSPSRLNRAVPRDLETICMAALAKEVPRRYATAGAMADDLDRFLAGEPPRARPIGPLGRTLRFVRRSPALASAVLLAVLLLVGTPSALLLQARGANREIEDALIRAQVSESQALELRDLAAAEAERANRESEVASEINLVLTHMFDSIDPSLRGRDVRVLEVLDELAIGVAELRPEVRAPLEQLLGRTYADLTMDTPAREHMATAAELMAGLPNVSREQVLEVESDVLLLDNHLGHYDEVLAGCDRLLGEYDDLGLQSAGLINVLLAQGGALRELGRPDEAEAALVRAQNLSAELDPDGLPGSVISSMLAIVLADQGRLDEAVPLMEGVLDWRATHYGELAADTIHARNTLAKFIRDAGDPEAALPMMERGVEDSIAVMGLNHRATASALHNLAGVHFDLNQIAAAEERQRQALASAQSCLPADDPLIADCYEILSLILATDDRIAEAIAAQELSIATRQQRFGEAHVDTVEGHFLLARFHMAMGALDAGAQAFEAARAGVLQIDDAPPLLLPIIVSNLLEVYEALGDEAHLAAAEAEFERVRGPLDEAQAAQR